MFIRFLVIEMNCKYGEGRSATGTFSREQIDVIDFTPYENDRLGRMEHDLIPRPVRLMW